MSAVLAAAGLGSVQDLLLFMAAVFLLNATPGVDLLLTVTRTLQGGMRAGLAAAAGISTGCAVHALAAAFGLAALLAVSATAFAAVKWLGAAYLLWMAVGLLRQSMQDPPAAAADEPANRRSGWADFRTGLFTNVLNPKVALFFLAFLPQFIGAGTVDKTCAFLLLGVAFVLQGSVFLAGVVLMCARLRRLAVPPGVRRTVQGLAGGLFAVLALRLAGTRAAGA